MQRKDLDANNVTPIEIILSRATFFTWRRVLTLNRVATVSAPIVAETCARRGAGFSRFLQLVPGEGESQTTGRLCVLHFSNKGQHTNEGKAGAMLNLKFGDRLELFYENFSETAMRPTVIRL